MKNTILMKEKKKIHQIKGEIMSLTSKKKILWEDIINFTPKKIHWAVTIKNCNLNV